MTENWFAHRTFHPDDLDIDELAARKDAAGLRTSVVLPSRNEAETIEGVIKSVTALYGRLVDEVMVIDGGSTDGTRALAEAAGVIAYDEREVFPDLGPGRGKGDAMWRSLSVTSGDFVVFIDADIHNPDPRFVSSVLGPLLLHPEIQLVKGFYERPIEIDGILHPRQGGRVTELCARPLLNMFWPELAGLAQPLSGEFAARRELFESIPFSTGYGVEIGMLIDTLTVAGADAIAQVDLGQRIHSSQPLEALSRMAFEVMQAAVRRLSQSRCLAVTDDGLPERFVQFLRGIDGRFERVERSISVTERPPMRDFRRQIRDPAHLPGAAVRT